MFREMHTLQILRRTGETAHSRREPPAEAPLLCTGLGLALGAGVGPGPQQPVSAALLALPAGVAEADERV